MKRIVVILLAVLASSIGGLAYAVASIPGPDGVIHGCYSTKNGALALIDPGATCPKDTTALNWNQTGPQGPAGPGGPQGPQGPQGPAGVGAAPHWVTQHYDNVDVSTEDPNNLPIYTIACPAGETIIQVQSNTITDGNPTFSPDTLINPLQIPAGNNGTVPTSSINYQVGNYFIHTVTWTAAILCESVGQ